jgi:hypothetical protein
MSGEQPFSPQEEEWFNKGEAKAQNTAPEIKATDNETKKTDNEVDEEKWYKKAA